MPEFDTSASDHVQSRYDEMIELHERYVDPEITRSLKDHITKVKGKNRGKKSYANTRARKGPAKIDGMTIEVQNSVTKNTLLHEMGHGLIDSMGYDASQEATDRANNKSNYSRWPQFSWGKKDSPVERFMLRRYGDLEEIRRIPFTDIEHHEDRSDIFWIGGHDPPWYETHCYRLSEERNVRGQRHEKKRYMSPVIKRNDDLYAIRVQQLSSHISSLDIRPEKPDVDVEVVDRYELTPGLTDVLDEDHQIEWSGFDRLVYEVNRAWHEAAVLVRKRGDKRERGMKMTPAGKSKSYYLMNTHEFLAELHSRMLLYTAEGRYEDAVERMREYIPHVIEAYEEEVLL